MSRHPNIVNVDEVAENEDFSGQRWGSAYKVLTPVMGSRTGRLGANISRVPKGRSSCPFHAHQLEDEIFFVLSGRGIFRYGDEIREVRAGDCIACPAGTGVAHQLGNPYDEDLLYLAVGRDDPNEVCVYPDNGKVLVRSLNRVGFLEPAEYMKGEPDEPKIFALAKQAKP